MKKDFIKYRQFLRKQNLSVNEQYMMELFYEFHNEKFGYAFPTFKNLLDAFNTTSKNRITKVIQELEEKGFITVDRTGRNNRYIINDLTTYLANEETKATPEVEDVIEDAVVAPEVEEETKGLTPAERMKKAILDKDRETTEQEIMPIVGAYEILDGTLEDYTELVNKYGTDTVIKSIQYAFAYEKPYLRTVKKFIIDKFEKLNKTA